jgi:3-deoxy-manno-octulosonate cytidylyltransferase (CMP-KDO synthetase)
MRQAYGYITHNWLWYNAIPRQKARINYKIRMNPILIIPARLAATRFPNKPLALINGLPMIVQVLHRAQEAKLGEVLIAAGDQEIVDIIHQAGGKAILTPADLPSGTDRIHHALLEYDPSAQHDVIINVQGDLPALDPAIIREALYPLKETDADITTLVSEIKHTPEKTDPNVVKAVVSWGEEGIGRALYFTRASAPFGEGAMYHHIGLYAYRRAALEHFVALPPSPLEKQEKLEQLRALEAGMHIAVARVNTVPHGVDTPNDAIYAEQILRQRKPS